MGFRGGTKFFHWVHKSPIICVINVGNKERDNEETNRSFDNDVSFEVDDWKEIEEYIRNPELFNRNHSFITILFTELIATV